MPKRQHPKLSSKKPAQIPSVWQFDCFRGKIDFVGYRTIFTVLYLHFSKEGNTVSNYVDCSTFKAWIDKMPGAENTLHVFGIVKNPTTADHAYLVEAVPGINPKILLLDVKRTRKPGQGGEVILPQQVSFHKEDSPSYSSVTVRDGQENCDVTIEIIQ
jgi:hypothetical protein